jgi:hypothetical protein
MRLPDGVAMIAHTMKGSARGIGAWRVARAAEAVELAGGTETGARSSVLPPRPTKRAP